MILPPRLAERCCRLAKDPIDALLLAIAATTYAKENH